MNEYYTAFQPPDPVYQAMDEQVAAFFQLVAASVTLRHNHASQFMSYRFQGAFQFQRITSSPAFVREPEGNGFVDRFLPAPKGQSLSTQDSNAWDQLAERPRQFGEQYNDHPLVGKLNFQSPGQAHERLPALEATPSR